MRGEKQRQYREIVQSSKERSMSLVSFYDLEQTGQKRAGGAD